MDVIHRKLVRGRFAVATCAYATLHVYHMICLPLCSRLLCPAPPFPAAACQRAICSCFSCGGYRDTPDLPVCCAFTGRADMRLLAAHCGRVNARFDRDACPYSYKLAFVVFAYRTAHGAHGVWACGLQAAYQLATAWRALR